MSIGNLARMQVKIKSVKVGEARGLDSQGITETVSLSSETEASMEVQWQLRPHAVRKLPLALKSCR